MRPPTLTRLLRTALVLALIPATGRSQGIDAQERARRLAGIRQAVAASVDELEKRLSMPGAAPSIRDLPNAALATLILSKNGPAAEDLIRREFSEQNMDAASPDFGSLPWQIGHPEIQDANAIEFGMQAIGPIWLGYGQYFSAGFKQEMAPHLRAALAAIRRHQVKVTYTNMFLMKTVNLILVGEAAGDDAAAAEGYANLDEWMAWTRLEGICEFDSPTYYAVDLSSLATGCRYAARPAARANFKAILDYLWRDIAANFFPARGSLSGPHSRDYDFLRGEGALDVYLYAEGFRDSQNLQKLDLEKALLLEATAAYQPPAGSLDSARVPEKVVMQRWNLLPAAQRYNYVTPDFAIGSTSGDYGPQDRLFSVELGGSNTLPVISVVPDVYDQPYGLQKIKGGDGHGKPRHIPLHLTAVQQKGAALLMLDLDPRKETDFGTFATNVILPADAGELVLNGHPICVSPSLAERAKVGALVGVKEGNAGVVIRVFLADGCAGQMPELILKADPEGLRKGALRLAIYHYRGSAQPLSENHVRVGLLVIAARCETDGAFATLIEKAGKAAIDEEDSDGIWKVRVALGDLTLEAARDLDRRSILYRRVNGKEVEFPPLSLLQTTGRWPNGQ
jgi:hypothetical protein